MLNPHGRATPPRGQRGASIGGYMQTKTFLDVVLGCEGWSCLFATRKKDNSRVQKFFSTTDELLKNAVELDKEDYDVYFGLATYQEKGSRKTNNVKGLRSFFLDLDCGTSKDYPDQSSALKALKSFCIRLKLPKPTLVNSGRGIHVYWALDKMMSFDEWQPRAEKLKVLCAEHGLLADPVVTADAARVLRVPFTRNHKEYPPLQTTTLGIGTTVSQVVFDSCIGGTTVPPPKQLAPARDINKYSHMESHFKDIILKSRNGTGCGQIILAVDGDKDNINEPVWRGVLSILKACKDGTRERAHLLSKGHSGYNEYETDSKWDNLDAEMPYTCVRFNENNLGICESCKHWGKVGSPKTLGNRMIRADGEVVKAKSISIPTKPTTTYTIPKYPDPYFRGVNGGVFLNTCNKEGDNVELSIYHNDLYVVERVKDAEEGESIVMRLHLPKDGVQEFTVPLTAVTSREEFRKKMSAQGVAITRMDDLMQYTTTWVNELQATEGAKMAHKQFGWVGEECESFVLGNQEIFVDHIEFNPPSTQTAGLMPSFEARGTFEGWKKTIDFYNKEGFELHQYVVGTGFGSVLMKFMGEISCSALHLYSQDSGVGKTTAMLAALSIWGRPSDLMLHERDTYNSKMNRGEIMHNLPLCMDELTNATGKQLSDIAYQFTSGKQRMRMSGGSNIERYRGEPWNLLAVTTGNTSIVELIGVIKALPKAEAQRILEINVKRLFTKSETKQKTDEFARNIEENCGWAGVRYIQYLLANLENIRPLLEEIQVRVDRAAELTSENRFWSAGITATIAGLMFAKRAGLINYEIKPIFSWIIEQVATNKSRTNALEMSPDQTLNDYMNEHWSNVLWIKSTDDLRSKDTVVIPDAIPKGRLVARYETDVKKAYLLPKPLKEWCGRQQIVYSSFIDDLMKKKGAKRAKVRMTKGTHIRLAPADVIIVDCAIDAETTRS